MSTKADPTTRWFAGWRRARPQVQDDPADLGTCFGLELSMDPAHVQPPGPPPVRHAGWMRRWTARRKAL